MTTTEWPYPHFTRAEMMCRCGCEGVPQDRFMLVLEEMRVEANFPFIISSGFRCAQYNAIVAESSVGSAHVQGLAADIVIYGFHALKVVELALKYGMTGIGVSQKGDKARRFLHVDIVAPGNDLQPRPWIWSY